jgi:formate hydrogenlyase subunit 6/NADH:ubiquinone oxidoreductase subunit I
MKKPSYLRSVVASLAAMAKGMRLSGRHFVKGHKRAVPLGIADPDYFKQDQGPITIQYPMQKVPVPDTGRYRLFMETDDCIACDKCARICPVDCITIESFRADGDLGKTSDGTVKRLHLPVFDIDMGKCMYCGLCTTVCPTECLFMTPVYDFSEFDRDNLVYHFGAYSPEEEGRIRSLTEAAIAAKKAAKQADEKKAIVEEAPKEEKPEGVAPPKPRPRPMTRPIMKRSEDEPKPADEEQLKKDPPFIHPPNDKEGGPEA